MENSKSYTFIIERKFPRTQTGKKVSGNSICQTYVMTLSYVLKSNIDINVTQTYAITKVLSIAFFIVYIKSTFKLRGMLNIVIGFV